MKYLFQLGHQPQISAAEITAVLSLHRFTASSLHHRENFLNLETDQQLNCEGLIEILGGTIKIMQKINFANIADYLLTKKSEGKIHFSLSGPDSRQLALEAKKTLKSAGCSVRYIEPKNTATILHNSLIQRQTDLTIFANEIFVTKAIQPFEEFSQRDYDRPQSDNKSGMLPPKLARIMINLAQIPKNAAILDPFCGSGTILTEAMVMGYGNLIGSDISAKAVADTEKNLEWTKDNYLLSPISYLLCESPATQLTKHIKPASVDAIITEPLLGKPLTGRENIEKLQAQTDELAKLYIDSFKTFAKILKPGGVVLFIIPKFLYKDEWVEMDCVDKIKKTGFKTVPFEILGSKSVEHLTYHRPDQHLARTIWRFKKER